MSGFARAALLAVFVALLLTPRAWSQSFTYQGRLTNAGELASGPHDMRFTLYAAPTGGAALSTTVCMDNVDVVDGLFTVRLPMTMPLTSADTYLSVEIRADGGGDCSVAGGYSTLLPRQIVGAAPRATLASSVGTDSIARDGAIRVVPGERLLEIYDTGFWYRIAAIDIPTAPRSNTQFNTPGVHQFVVPANTYNIWVQAFGAAGGGGDRGPGTTTMPTECQSGFGTYSTGGGGGASGSAAECLIKVTPGEVLTITVGTGGAAGVSTSGGAGGVTRVRRASSVSDTVTAPGGGGGGRRANVVTMGTDTANIGCVGQAAGGSPGAAAGLPTFGDIVLEASNLASPGTDGGGGLGPSCYDGSPDGFCPSAGGLGGEGIQLGSGFSPLSGTGSPGGNGAGIGLATAGGPGLVKIWWN